MNQTELIESYGPLAQGMAWRAYGRMATRGQAMNDIDDLTQDALMALIEAGESYDATTKVPFKTWAGRIIAARIVDGIRERGIKGFRRGKKCELLPQFLPLSTIEGTPQEPSMQEEHTDPQEIWNVVNKMSHNHRTALTMSYRENKQFSEIKNFLTKKNNTFGVSEASVSITRTRALAALREKLRAEDWLDGH